MSVHFQRENKSPRLFKWVQKCKNGAWGCIGDIHIFRKHRYAYAESETSETGIFNSCLGCLYLAARHTKLILVVVGKWKDCILGGTSPIRWHPHMVLAQYWLLLIFYWLLLTSSEQEQDCIVGDGKAQLGATHTWSCLQVIHSVTGVF